MIPLRDNAAPRRLTPVNVALIAVNLAVFVYELSLGARVAAFVEKFALVPTAVTQAFTIGTHRNLATLAPLMTTVTSMFVHGGFWHIAGNMLYLFIFGAAVEYRMGAARYLIFYCAAGIAAALATVWIAPESSVPVIGASGAIAGVLGAYFILYPRGRILTILPIFVFIQFIEIPAVIYLFVWFAAQLYAGVEQSGRAAAMGGVAWWAHVGGFMFGIALGPMLAINRPRRRGAR
ncbi:MAG TPA: rhomboid family intramembrane serine protease [Candidatus Binatus sp.]|jgi:membrane associated rhomboid family serine protease|uniref:rhomboid family intramembrane serine protease n=1 Tax=Candidatus Binatus sp. TaxID=2811406 RepID=UPI002F40108D